MQLLKTHTFTSSISTLSTSNETLLIGHSDGFIESYPTDFIFSSHSSSYDYLESAEISERITCISQIDLGDGKTSIIAGNERNIKLWSVHKKRQDSEKVFEFKTKPHTHSTISPYCLKPLSSTTMPRHKLVRGYGDLHLYNLHGITTIPHSHTFMTVDYLQVLFHNLVKPSFTLLNIKPDTIDSLTFLITSLNMHTAHSFIYTTSSGDVVLNDMRIQPKGMTVSKFNGSEFIRNAFIENHITYLRTPSGISEVDFRNTRRCVNQVPIGDQDYNAECYEKIGICVRNGNIVTGSNDGKLHCVRNNKVQSVALGDGIVKCVGFYGDQIVCGKERNLYIYNKL